MDEKRFRLSVFTKAWRTMPLPELARFVRHLGFDGVELPVRPGFQVPPERALTDLPLAVKQFAEEGLTIYSIAAPVEEATIAACAEAGVPILRTMAQILEGETYLQAEERLRRTYDATLPLLEKYGVTLGIQNHCDRFVANAVGLMRLIGGYDPRYIAAVWDAGHEAVNGGLPEYALDVVWSHLCMVNFKNAFWLRTNGPEAPQAEWRHYWTLGRHGLSPWPRIVADLKRRGYDKVLCLTAEYTDEARVNALIAEDVAYVKALLAE